MAKPGDIVQSAKILFQDPMGRYWLEIDSKRAFVSPKYAEEDDFKGDHAGSSSIGGLICLGKEEFGIKNYESRLCQHFYRKGGKISPEALGTWVPRWRFGAANPDKLKIKIPEGNTNLPMPPADRSWRFIDSDSWIMPAFISAFTKDCEGEDAFCPSGLNDDSPMPSVYNSGIYGGASDDQAPLKYTGKLIGGILSEGKQVPIFLHGALHPLKWHTGIRRHVLTTTPDANRTEKPLWELFLNEKLPDEKNAKQIFNDCRYKLSDQPNKRSKGMCLPCSSEEFFKVHDKISHISRKYWQKAVTYWESNATKRIETEIGPDRIMNLTVKVFSKQIFNLKGKNVVRYPLLVLKGWCYDDLLSGASEPAIHLNVLTFYFANNLPDENSGTVLPKMEIRDVSRI